MSIEALTPENTTVIMIDYAIGFVNLVRSHDITIHQNNVLLLARTAPIQKRIGRHQRTFGKPSVELSEIAENSRRPKGYRARRNVRRFPIPGI